MSIVSKLTLPVLVGGVVALFTSGVLSPPVFAGNSISDTVARIVLDHDATKIDLTQMPDVNSPRTGTLPGRYWVWVERCISDDIAGEWCLIERGNQRGWVQAGHLELFSD